MNRPKAYLESNEAYIVSWSQAVHLWPEDRKGGKLIPTAANS